MKRIGIIIAALCFSLKINAQEIQWVNFDQLSELQQTDNRPLLIFIHTNWCRYCKMQKEISFKNLQLIEFLNRNYYCIELDAESKSTIEFLDKNYSYNPVQGFHQLTLTLTKDSDQIIFPTLVVLDKSYRIKSVLQSYQEPQSLIKHLKTLN